MAATSAPGRGARDLPLPGPRRAKLRTTLEGVAFVNIQIIQGDALDVLRTLPDKSVQCCVTSPPYWGLRDYGVPGQLGLEPTPEEYVSKMVEVFREVRRVLRDDGTLWLNLGDSYNAYNGGAGPSSALSRGAQTEARPRLATGFGLQCKGLKPKDLIGIPWRVAFALQADGWYLRSDIIWAKPNPMPESVTDRPTKAHEYVFLLSKSKRYYYNADAIAGPCESGESDVKKMIEARDRIGGKALLDDQPLHAANANTNIGKKRAVGGKASGNKDRKLGEDRGRPGSHIAGSIPWPAGVLTRNARTVWTIATQGFKEAHFATMPPELARRCIVAGSKPGDIILDPFAGAGTTLLVADRNGRDGLGIELNPNYCEMARRRINDDAPLLVTQKQEDGDEENVVAEH